MGCRKTIVAWCLTVALLVQQWQSWKLINTTTTMHQQQHHHHHHLPLNNDALSRRWVENKANRTDAASNDRKAKTKTLRNSKTAAIPSSIRSNDMNTRAATMFLHSTSSGRNDLTNIPNNNVTSNNNNSNSNTNIPFSWDDIDFTIKPDCGKEKCFHVNRYNPNIGYLIAKGTQAQGQWRAWNISQSITRLLSNVTTTTTTTTTTITQSRHHFYSNRPPIEMLVDDNITQRLGQLRKGHNKQFFVGSRALVIQEVDVALSRSELKIIHCSNSRMMTSCKHILGQLVLANVNRTHMEQTKIRQTFQQSISNTMKVLNHHPNLVYDFQVFLSTNGEIYHLDLDRGRRPAPSQDIDVCQSNLLAYLDLIR